MNANLLSSALTVIPNPQMVVNVVRLRVKQLSLGHRPLVTVMPGLGFADIALTEIVDGKLTFESTIEQPAVEAAEAKVLEFPGVPPRKKQAA
jgi:DNA-directed RNA polymerase subunit omega